MALPVAAWARSLIEEIPTSASGWRRVGALWRSFKESIALSDGQRLAMVRAKESTNAPQLGPVNYFTFWAKLPPHVCDVVLFPLFLIRQFALKNLKSLWRSYPTQWWAYMFVLPALLWLVAAIVLTVFLVALSIVCAVIEWPLMLITLVTSPSAWRMKPVQTLCYSVAFVGMGLMVAGVVVGGVALWPFALAAIGVALTVNVVTSLVRPRGAEEREPKDRRAAVITGVLLVLAGLAILCLIVLPVFFPPAALFTIPVLSYGVPWFSTTLAFAVTGAVLFIGGVQAMSESAPRKDYLGGGAGETHDSMNSNLSDNPSLGSDEGSNPEFDLSRNSNTSNDEGLDNSRKQLGVTFTGKEDPLSDDDEDTPTNGVGNDNKQEQPRRLSVEADSSSRFIGGSDKQKRATPASTPTEPQEKPETRTYTPGGTGSGKE